MPLFGNTQTASIIMQGVQMLNNALQQTAALQQQKEQQDRVFAMKQEEIETHQRKIDAEAKFNQLDFQIKTAQARKAELEAASAAIALPGAVDRQKLHDEKLSAETQLKALEAKEAANGNGAGQMKALKERVLAIDEQLKAGNLMQQTRKINHLTVAKEDPNPLMRRFESVADLSDYRDSVSRQLNDPFLDNQRRTSMTRELQAVDSSLTYRLDRVGKEFGETRQDATKPIDIPDTSASAPPAQASREAAAVSSQTLPTQPISVKQLVLDTQDRTKSPDAKATIQKMLQQNRSAGNDQTRRFMSELLDSAPGSTPEEKTAYVRSLLGK